MFALMITREEGDSNSNDPIEHVNSLQLTIALQIEGLINKLTYVLVLVNGVGVKAMIDKSSTHNFMVSKEATRISLNLKEDTC